MTKSFPTAMSRVRPSASSLAALRRMKSQRQRDTEPETALRSALHMLGFRFRVDYRLPEMRRRADIAFPRLRIAVFVDGCFWHACPSHRTYPKANAEWWHEKIAANVSRDRDTDIKLRAIGWRSVRIWEHDDVSDATAAVLEAIADVERCLSGEL